MAKETNIKKNNFEIEELTFGRKKIFLSEIFDYFENLNKLCQKTFNLKLFSIRHEVS